MDILRPVVLTKHFTERQLRSSYIRLNLFNPRFQSDKTKYYNMKRHAWKRYLFSNEQYLSVLHYVTAVLDEDNMFPIVNRNKCTMIGG